MATMGAYHEKLVGSVRYFCFFVVSTALIELVFDILMLLASKLASDKYMENESYGLLPLILAEIVVDAYKDPEADEQYAPSYDIVDIS